MKITFSNKPIQNIESSLEIILLKKHKLLKANNMFIQKNKLYVKIANFKYSTITETLTNTIQYINNFTVWCIKYKDTSLNRWIAFGWL